MKCVRCGKETKRKSSFCKECEDFVINGDKVENEDVKTVNDDEFSINWGYFMVTLSVIAVAVMIAFIVYCNK